MSRRYGRQQKRKAKAEINALIVDKQFLRDKLDQSDHVKASAQEVLRMVREISPNSIIFDPVETRHGSRYIHQPELSFNVAPEGCRPEPMDIRFIDLYALEIELRKEEFRDAVHVIARFRNPFGDDIGAGYAATRQAIKNMPHEQLGRILADHIKKAC